MNILNIIKNILRKKNPDYMKLFKKHGLGQVRISDNDILEIFHDAAIYYKIYIIQNYGIHPKKTYRKMRHRIDGPSYIPKFIDWSNKDCQNQWFNNGDPITETIKTWATFNEIDLDNLTDTDRLLIRVQFLQEFGLSDEVSNIDNSIYVKPPNNNFPIIQSGGLVQSGGLQPTITHINTSSGLTIK